MTRSHVWTYAAVAASLAASLLALVRVRRVPDRDALDLLERRIDALEAAGGSAPSEPDGSEGVARMLSELSERLARLESVPRREPMAVERSPGPVGVAEAAAPAPLDESARREFESLLALFGPDFHFGGTPEQMKRFQELAREGGLLDASIAELEASVAGDPADLEARMALADLYVTKIWTLPHGPEQGIWGDKAEEQWRAVTERDPDHWRANFQLGNNFAYYPDVMGKTEEAIHFLEEARRIQERGVPGDEEVRVYLALSRLHLRQGEQEEARAVLESGLRRHPSNGEILRALEELDG